MLYAAFSYERSHTRPSRFAGGNRNQGRRLPERHTRGEVMSFSADVFSGRDARMDTSPVDLADRRERMNSYMSAPAQQPVNVAETVRIPALSREGVKASTALILLAVMLFSMGVTWLVYRSQIIEAGKRIAATQISENQLLEQAEGLEKEIANITTDVSIAEKARDMGMISSRSVAVVNLTAPEDAVYTPTSDVPLTGSYLANILGD